MTYNKRVSLFLIFGVFFMSFAVGWLEYNVFTGGWEGLKADMSGTQAFWYGKPYDSTNGFVQAFGDVGATKFIYDIEDPNIGVNFREDAFPRSRWTCSIPMHTTQKQRVTEQTKASPSDYVYKITENVSTVVEVIDLGNGDTDTIIRSVNRTFYLRYFYFQVAYQSLCEVKYNEYDIYVHYAFTDWWTNIADFGWGVPTKAKEFTKLDGMGRTTDEISVRIPFSVDHWDEVRDNNTWSGIMQTYIIESWEDDTGSADIDSTAVWNMHTPTLQIASETVEYGSASIPINMFYEDTASIYNGLQTETPSGGLDSNIPNSVLLEFGVTNVHPDIALRSYTFDTHGKGWYIEHLGLDKDYDGLISGDENVQFFTEFDHTYTYIDVHEPVNVIFTWDCIAEVMQTQDEVYTTTITNRAGTIKTSTKVGEWGDFQDNPLFTWIMWIIIIIVVAVLLKWLFGKKHPQGGASTLSKVKYLGVGVVVGIALPMLLFLFGLFRLFSITVFSTIENVSFALFSVDIGTDVGGTVEEVTILSSQYIYGVFAGLCFFIALSFYWMKKREKIGEPKSLKPEIVTAIVFHGLLMIAGLIVALMLDMGLGLILFIPSTIGLFIWIFFSFGKFAVEENDRITAFVTTYFSGSMIFFMFMIQDQLFLKNPLFRWSLTAFWLILSGFVFLDAIFRIVSSVTKAEPKGIVVYLTKPRVILAVIFSVGSYLLVTHTIPMGNIPSQLHLGLQLFFLGMMVLSLVGLWTQKNIFAVIYNRLRGIETEKEQETTIQLGQKMYNFEQREA